MAIGLLLVQKAYSQMLFPQFISPLPPQIMESSGLQFNKSSWLWTHNDSGDSATLYALDLVGNLVKTLHLKNITNMDFEDITRDTSGNLYVGDFGNNLSNRQDLVIYKLSNPDTVTTDSITTEAIFFSYSDQITYPPTSSSQSFDCEAMVHFKGDLYLFTKKQGSQFTKLYKLPDSSGTFQATLLDSIYIPGAITGADISPDQTKLILISYGSIYLFDSIQQNNFFGGNLTTINIPVTQTEGITFFTNTSVFITDEKYSTIGGNLYELDISAVSGITNPLPHESFPLIYPVPCNDYFFFVWHSENINAVDVNMYNQYGQNIFYTHFKELVYKHHYSVPINNVPVGVYQLEFVTSNSTHVSKIIINR